MLVVGFDLDMTLFDTRPGVKRVFEALASAEQIEIDADLVVSRLGPPLAVELANWVEADRIDEFVEKYRALYPQNAIEFSLLMAGAAESVDAIRDAGGQAMMVTAKHQIHARSHVDHSGLPIEIVVGGLWGEGKGQALREHGAVAYVGDHTLDIAGARAADAVAVAVATGPCSPEELADAGANVVLAGLDEFPAWFDSALPDLRERLLERRLRELGEVVVAFSGGADSAYLLATAVRVLGADRVTAATAVSASLPATEREQARAFAQELGARHVEVETREMDRDGYRRNDGDRCYFCKAELVDVLNLFASSFDGAAIATGTNADDAAAGFRPGIRAASERGAVTPLLDAGLTKEQIRALSRRRGLPTWDKPAAACLSSRIAYGVEVTPSRLARVERAELAVRSALAALGVSTQQLRVRDLGGDARVEVDRSAAELVLADAHRRASVVEAVVGSGFETASIDPRGFRSGSMNEALPDPARYR